MKPQIVLVGGGGHCKACIDVIEQQGLYRIAGIVDVAERLHERVLGYEIIATDHDLPDLTKDYSYFHITLGQIKTPDMRIRLFGQLFGMGVALPSIVSPLAYVSRHAKIGSGTIVMHHAVINADAMVGCNCIVNNKALIEHDAVIGDHCHISTAAVINGGCRIGNGVFIGSNAVCREMIKVGDNVIIGCSCRVMTDS